MAETESGVTETTRVEARAKVWFERDGKLVLSEWRMDLLSAVGKTGSLTRAAERMHVPYRTAWSKLKEIEDELGISLLKTQSGGMGGGGSTLTPAALDLIDRFGRVRAGVAELVRERFEAEFSGRLG